MRKGTVRSFCLGKHDGAATTPWKDFEKVIETLTTDTCLTRFAIPYWKCLSEETRERFADVLESHNTMLEDIGIESRPQLADADAAAPCKHTSRMELYSTLNRFGRGKVMDSSTSLSDFVDVLCGVADVDESSFPSSIPKHAVQYALLRLAPGVWSAPQSSY